MDYSLDGGSPASFLKKEKLEMTPKSNLLNDAITIPESSQELLSFCVKEFPHFRQPETKLLPFVRQLIQLAEHCGDEEVAVEIWSLIVDRLLQLDATTADAQFEEENRLSFCQSENQHLSEENGSAGFGDDTDGKCNHENPIEQKLDKFFALVLLYIGSRSGQQFDLSVDPKFGAIIATEDECLLSNVNAFLQINRTNDGQKDGIDIGCSPESDGTAVPQNNENATVDDDEDDAFEPDSKRMQLGGRPFDGPTLFRMLLEPFDEQLLSTTGVHSTPFLWFYICSLSKENCSLMLEYLWEVLNSGVDEASPNQQKKAQNGAAFLSGFLARANFVDFSTVCEWLTRISGWCLQYIAKNSANGKKNGRHGPLQQQQHGTFYAAVQALLFTICYRHDQLQQLATDTVDSWKLGQVLCNWLNPLQNISQGVALCFLNLNRRLHLLINSDGSLHDPSSASPTHHPPTSAIAVAKRRYRSSAAAAATTELFFPFSFCSLKICSPLLLPLMRRFVSPSMKTEEFHSDEKMSEEDGMAMAEDDSFNFGGKDLTKLLDVGTDTETTNSTVYGLIGVPLDEGFEEELMSVNDMSTFLLRDYGGQQPEEEPQYEGEKDEQHEMET